MANTVHVVFKTHLDVGFTDFAAAVLQRYFKRYIPEALRTARELRASGGPDRFVWTTGSWIIHEYLEKADRTARKEAEEGIRAGDLHWHALPFTTHSELLDAGLYRFGLSIAKTLDARFGVRTIAAKMTDVPGHTRGIVPLLADVGIRFLHIGVNAASRAPDVPPLFRWQEPETGAEVMVMYNAAGYGGVATVEALGTALCIAHTGDNMGPQTSAEVRRELGRVRAQFPDHDVKASTLDAFAAELEAVRGSLPVVRHEIGDTWIHGTASDPWKVAGFRALLRMRSQWLTQNGAYAEDPAFRRFSSWLLLVAEHTWGMDAKIHLADYENYSRLDFEKARARDVVPDDPPPRYRFTEAFRRKGTPRSYSKMEASWNEQREYLRQAAAELWSTDLAGPAAEALEAGTPREFLGGTALGMASVRRALDFDHFRVRFSSTTGSIVSLVHRRSSTQLAAHDHALALFRYQSFSSEDYERFIRAFVVNLDNEDIRAWALADYGRLGLGPEHSQSAFYEPRAVSVARRGESVLFNLMLPPLPRERYGGPASLQLIYTFPRTRPVVEIELSWSGKPANRMPEASWLSFVPRIDDADCWDLHKMGRWISPLEVVSRGARNMHGIGEGVRLARGAYRLVIESLDTHLVSPGAPRLLQFDDTLPRLRGGMHFCLHANVYSTNFPLWYEDAARFRFCLRFEDMGECQPRG